MPSEIDRQFYERIRAIRKLIALELTQLHQRHTDSGDPMLADWIDRLRACLRATQVSSSNNKSVVPESNMDR